MSSLSDTLLCFQHCKKVNIFCFAVPKNCPVCQQDLLHSDLIIPPFRIPSPFTCGEPEKLSLLVKPTIAGSFSRDFKKGDLLHIGVSSSERIIFEFKENGISYNKHDSSWHNFLSINLDSLNDRFELLDAILETTKITDMWTSERYDEVHNNCFDYVVYVLNASSEKSKCEWTKLRLTQEFISPAINRTIRFLSIVRKVLEMGFFLQSTSTEPFH